MRTQMHFDATTSTNEIAQTLLAHELSGLSLEDLPANLRDVVHTKGPALSPTSSGGSAASSPHNNSGKNNKKEEKSVSSPATKNASGRNNQFVISAPKGEATHVVHVDRDFQWSGQDPVGSFKILDKLGEGSYGSVYKAEAKGAGFQLAIKMILMGKDQGGLQREIDILKKLRHPNCVSYYGSAQKDTYLWIMMEWCAGGSVLDMMKASHQNLTEKEVMFVMYGTLLGLSYLHKSGIIHRDIKAGNILVSSDGNVKLADFGVSSQINQSLVKQQTFVGTALWMSPEVLLQQPYDARADIWAVGITGIEMADGVPPHFEKHVMRAMFVIPQADAPTVKNPDKFSHHFREFLSKSLVKDPQTRFTADQLLQHPTMIEAKDMKDGLRRLFDISARIKNGEDPIQAAAAVAASSPGSSPLINGSSSHPPKISPQHQVLKAGATWRSSAEIQLSEPKMVQQKNKPVDRALEPLLEAKEMIEKIRSEIEKEKNRGKTLVVENEDLKKQCKDLKKELKEMEKDLNYAEEELEELEDKVSELEGKLESKKKRRKGSAARNEGKEKEKESNGS